MGFCSGGVGIDEGGLDEREGVNVTPVISDTPLLPQGTRQGQSRGADTTRPCDRTSVTDPCLAPVTNVTSVLWWQGKVPSAGCALSG